MGAVTKSEPLVRQLRLAGAYAAVGTIALALPAVSGQAPPLVELVVAVAPFLAIALVALVFADGVSVLDPPARPDDEAATRLYGLAAFALAIAGLGLLSTRFGLPTDAFVATALLVGYGNIAQQAVRGRGLDPLIPVAAFVVAGVLGGMGGMLVTGLLTSEGREVATVAFLSTSGALVAGVLRSVLFERDDPLVLLSVALLIWLFSSIAVAVPPDRFAIGLALAISFGAIAYRIEAASLSGMVTGVALALFAVVLGGYGWFAVLISFFALGGLASKFRHAEKRKRGVAEPNLGARSSGNVLANSAAGLLSVFGFAAAARLGAPPEAFLFAFTGSIAAAMSDTFSSEFGGLYDTPRLITTLEPVEPGTDGAVTWQGELAGIAGAAVVAAVAHPFFDLTPAGGGIIVFAGFAGMTVDSLLGATLEGEVIDNQGVNLIATLSAAVAAGALAISVGLA